MTSTHSSKLSQSCTKALLACALLAGLVLVAAAPAAAGTGPTEKPCFNAAGCSSNDLNITSSSAVGAGADPTCSNTSDTIDLEIAFTVVVRSGADPTPEAQQRFDIGVWVEKEGGTCGVDVFTATNSNAPNFDDDACLDLTTTSVDYSGIYTGIPCTDADTDGFVDPFILCGTWGNQANQIGGAGGCSLANVDPGTNPKCQCNEFDPQITVPVCGDGILNQKSEVCDDGNDVDNDLCGNDCQPPVCGDGVVEGDEACDVGAAGAGQCCDAATCQFIGTCGNGVQECAEECDDGNVVDTDACTGTCQNALCGDGFVQDGVEQCDDANTVDTDACGNDCTLPVCGNGEIELKEQCDDGNTNDGDGCSAACGLETVCGNGTVEGVEQCDDGNTADGDGCSANCTVEVPTMGEYGLGALAFLLLGAGIVATRKGNLI